MVKNKVQLAELLEGFVNGTCDEWEWDDFISVPQKDPELEAVRLRCETLDVEFPPRKAREYCNDEGAAILLNYAQQLRIGS